VVREFLLDTNVLSEFSRTGKPNQEVQRWLSEAIDSSLFASVLTIAEIRRGIELLPSSKRRDRLEQWLHHELIPSFVTPFLPITHPVADLWALTSAQAEIRGKSLSIIDGLIAATALHHNLILVTRNVRDFEGLGVEIVNPWNLLQI